MASQTTEEILKFVVKASGNESLTPIVRTILDLSGNSAEALAALGATARLCYACDLDAARAASLAQLAPGCQAIGDYHAALADLEKAR